ncbi:MAG: glycosyltransferase, partial [Acidimicrobiales bacterium]
MRSEPFGRSGGNVELTNALRWSVDQIAGLLPEPEETGNERLEWAGDASSEPIAYRYWVKDLESRTSCTAPREGPLISIVVPVYRPEVWYFRECVQSVLNQTYQHWELCMCDDGSEDPALTSALEEFAASDSRIKFVSHERNGGISRATNTALQMCSGSFVALLDHDDALHSEALAHVVQAIESEPDAEVVYTDEDK